MRIAFADVRELLRQLIDRREPIIEQIEARLLNLQGTHPQVHDRITIERILASCFGGGRAVDDLSAAHAAAGFEIVPLEQRAHVFDAADLTARAWHHWNSNRWPGRNGRLAYARTLFAAYMLRRLEHLAMRAWDDGNNYAAARLGDVQRLLDQLNGAIAPRAFVRDARWLMQTAQGALTRHLEPYFTAADRMADSFTGADRVEIHKAGAKLAGGHLRSQWRYRSRESGLAPDDPGVLMVTRNSNSMDVALLVHDLVPLLEAYIQIADQEQRLDLADAILQGISADPELLVRRVDLLGPYTTIEDAFAGSRHDALIARYRGLIAQAGPRLIADAESVDSSNRSYSPFGIAYGFCADILANLATSGLLSARATTLALEDFFARNDDDDERLAFATAHFDYSAEWANEMFRRTIDALGARRDARPQRLFVVTEGASATELPDGVVRAREHCVTSDLQRALATGATAFPKAQILLDRREARFLASAESGGTWFGVSKTVLTVLASQERDLYITDVPGDVAEMLRATCPELLVIL